MQTCDFSLNQKPNGTRGFTLVELLVVIAIIALMSGFIVAAVGGDDGKSSLDAGISRADGMFSLARSAAITRKTRTRVLVHYDNNDMERYLRYMIVIYQDENGQWQLFSEGETLPRGVYFSPALSSRDEERLYTTELTIGSPPNYPLNITDGSLRRRISADVSNNVDPLNRPRPGPGLWYAYEFNSNGTALFPMQRFVLSRGVVPPDGSELRIPNLQLIGGFVVFRSGNTHHFQDPMHVGAPST